LRLLLDTHLLLWWLEDSPLLSGRARRLIEAPENTVFVSAASIWEVRIKQGLGKLALPGAFDRVLLESSFELLAVTVAHANAIRELPAVHRDPFDRMLVAQATVEKLLLITSDARLAEYGPMVEWVGQA